METMKKYFWNSEYRATFCWTSLEFTSNFSPHFFSFCFHFSFHSLGRKKKDAKFKDVLFSSGYRRTWIWILRINKYSIVQEKHFIHIFYLLALYTFIVCWKTAQFHVAVIKLCPFQKEIHKTLHCVINTNTY